MSDNCIGGLVDFVAANPKLSSEAFIQSFGQLICLCSLFGITDLHHENVIPVETGLQVVDLECLFWESKTVSDTLLLHHNIENRADTLQNCFEKTYRDLGLDSSITLLVDSIRNTFNQAAFYRKQLILAFEETGKTESFGSYPIRIILKNTRFYRKGLMEVSLDSFFEEEREQLASGSIPYFYGYLDSEDVFFVSQNNVVTKVHPPNIPAEKLKLSFKNPQKLMTHQRVADLYKQVLLSTLKILLRNQLEYYVKLRGVRIKKKSDLLTVECSEFSIGCKT